jgi:hypothetical protein
LVPRRSPSKSSRNASTWSGSTPNCGFVPTSIAATWRSSSSEATPA